MHPNPLLAELPDKLAVRRVFHDPVVSGVGDQDVPIGCKRDFARCIQLERIVVFDLPVAVGVGLPADAPLGDHVTVRIEFHHLVVPRIRDEDCPRPRQS